MNIYKLIKTTGITLGLLIILQMNLPAQSDQNQKRTVFLDCESCPENFIRQQTTLVDFVRDRKVADIHLFISRIGAAGGGEQYELRFLDVREQSAGNITLKTDTSPGQTELEENQQLLLVIRAGLLPFVYQYKEHTLDIQSINTQKTTLSSRDPWNYWVFEVSGDFFWTQETRQSEYDLETEIDIERTTEQWRIRSEAYLEYELRKVKRKGETLYSELRNSGARASVVKSMGQHWSLGLFSAASSTTFDNIALGSRLQGAVEYNFFPYRESATKEFTVAYYVGSLHNQYLEETIYNRNSETRMLQSVNINYDVRQPWGRIEAEMEGSQYFFDLEKYRLDFETALSLRVFKGFFVSFSADAAVVRDQLYLPKGDASLEEILLERRAISTDYELGFSVGVSYTFGSIYNSVVNTRL